MHTHGLKAIHLHIDGIDIAQNGGEPRDLDACIPPIRSSNNVGMSCNENPIACRYALITLLFTVLDELLENVQFQSDIIEFQIISKENSTAGQVFIPSKKDSG